MGSRVLTVLVETLLILSVIHCSKYPLKGGGGGGGGGLAARVIVSTTVYKGDNLVIFCPSIPV